MVKIIKKKPTRSNPDMRIEARELKKEKPYEEREFEESRVKFERIVEQMKS